MKRRREEDDPIAKLREFEESVRQRNLRRNPFFGAPSYKNRINTLLTGKQMCYYTREGTETVLKTMPVGKMQQSDVEAIKKGSRFGIWVVPTNDPLNIHFAFKYPSEPAIFDEFFYLCSDPKIKINMMHHDNLLPRGEEIVCGGEFRYKNNVLEVNNRSGHYSPRPECLLVARQLFQDLGFESIKLTFYGKMTSYTPSS